MYRNFLATSVEEEPTGSLRNLIGSCDIISPHHYLLIIFTQEQLLKTVSSLTAEAIG